MKALIYYTDYLWDNHQGGSGVYVHSKIIMGIPDLLPAGEIMSWLSERLEARLLITRQYNQIGYKVIIIKIEIFNGK